MSTVCHVWGLSCLAFVVSRVCLVEGLSVRICRDEGDMCVISYISSMCTGYIVHR